MRRPVKIRQRSAAEQVSDEVLKRVERGEFSVGEKLPTEAELSRAFGVSRAVVREALGGMRATGVLRSERGRGTFVATDRPRNLLLLGRYSAAELHEVRVDLELPSAAAAARNRTDEDGRMLLDIVEQLEAADDVETWVRLDAAYHVAIARVGGNSVRVMLTDDLRDLHVVLSLAAATVEGRRNEADIEHRAIYEAIVAGRPEQAQEAMRRHLDTVTRRVADQGEE